jgi:hypothetical protein
LRIRHGEPAPPGRSRLDPPPPAGSPRGRSGAGAAVRGHHGHRRCRRCSSNVCAARLAGLVRGQWAIESLHWLSFRDTLYQEDHSQVRTRSGPRIMAALRILAIGGLHLAGRHDTTEATRWASRHMSWPCTILGLTS